MAAALAKADVVSVLASEPCYVWIYRKGEEHISETAVDPAIYWRDYAAVPAAFERLAGPGPLLDAARIIIAKQAFGRFTPKAYLARTPESRRALFDAVHPLFREHVPATLDDRFPVYKRLRVQALRAGDQARFDELQKLRGRFGFRLTTDAVSEQDGRLRVVASARCVRPARPKQDIAEQRNGSYLLHLDGELAATDADRRLLDEDLGSLEISIRHRASGVEWPVATQSDTRGPGLQIATVALVDVNANSFGAPLAPGRWDLVARLQFLGESMTTRLGPPAAGLVADDGSAPLDVHVNDNGGLAFNAGRSTPGGRPSAAQLTWQGRRLRLVLPESLRSETVLADARGTAEPRFTAQADGDGAVLEVDAVPGDGFVDFWLRDANGTLTRLGYDGPRIEAPGRRTPHLAAYATLHGSLSVTRTQVVAAARPPSRLRGWLGETARRLRR